MSTIRVGYDVGKNLYAVIQRLSDSKYRKTDGTYEVELDADWASYAHAIAESPSGSGKYSLAFPESGGTYWVQIVERLGATAATSDLPSAYDFPTYDPAAVDASAANAGAYAVALTVSNDVGPVQGASVRYSQAGVTAWVGTTDADGLATVSVNAGTYARTVTAAGHNGLTDTVDVAGSGTDAVTLSRVSVAVSDPGRVTLYARLYANDNSPAEGEVVTLWLKSGPGTAGYSYVKGEEEEATADANGDVSFTDKVPGATYAVRRGDGEPVDFTVPADASGAVAISEFLGAPSAS